MAIFAEWKFDQFVLMHKNGHAQRVEHCVVLSLKTPSDHNHSIESTKLVSCEYKNDLQHENGQFETPYSP